MTENKIQTAVAASAVGLTRHLMATRNFAQDEAYRALCATETFKLLSNPDTRLYLEPNDYLCKCLDVEVSEGINALYDFIKPEV